MHLMGHSRTIIAFGYIVAACACCLAGFRERRGAVRPVYPALWFVLAAALLVMAAQEYARLLSAITQIGRTEAVTGGWYWNRNAVQHMVIIAAPVVISAAALGLLWLFRRAWRRYLPAVCALAYLVAFGLIEAVSEHYVDRFLHARVILLVKVWGDLLGIGLALAAAGWTMVLDRDAGSKTRRDAGTA
jgi:hypothetical protein